MGTAGASCGGCPDVALAPPVRGVYERGMFPEKPVFADPKTDLAFKKAFGTREQKHLLIELLNALLSLDETNRIVDLEYLSPEQLPPHDGLKLSILDVKCLDALGVRYVVEMQVFPVEGFEKRVVLNACKAYVEQLQSGADYGQMSDVIAVTICDFNLWPASVGMLSRFRMREDASGHPGLQQLQYVFLELPKYPAGRKAKTTVEKWAKFFREADRLREVPVELREAPFAAAFEAVRRVNFSALEWTEYEREKMAEQDYRGGLTLARKEGFQEGRQEGIQEGRQEGESRGLRAAVLDLCEVLGLSVSAAEHAALERLDIPALSALRDHLKRHRAWPDDEMS